MKTEENNGNIIIYPVGTIDQNNSLEFQDELIEKAKGHEELIINMQDVKYISSAGLRVLVKLNRDKIRFRITDVSLEVYEIFRITGFVEMFDISRAMRTISVDGCDVIGQGFYGTIYRLDEDTIVKVYESSDSIPMIENERKCANLAFIKGIPTAISYDIVKVGDSYGAVFEMLKAKTFNDLLIEEPEKADELIEKYVDFIRLVHGTVLDTDSIPYAADKYKGYLDTIRVYLTDHQYDAMIALIDKLPPDDHAVHGDFHMKNVMMVDGEPMLIDMDTLSRGNAIFDLVGLYVGYILFIEDVPGRNEKFLGISDEMCHRIWNGVMELYFKDTPNDVKDEIFKKIRLLSAIRFLYIIEKSHYKYEPEAPIWIKHSQETIEELIERVDSLIFEV